MVNPDGSHPELYDLGRSSVEREDLAAQKPNRARQWADRLLDRRRSLPALPHADPQ